MRRDEVAIVKLDRKVVFGGDNPSKPFGVLEADTPLEPCIVLIISSTNLFILLLSSLAFVFSHTLPISVL
jgi:hypothetical protein